MDNSAVKASIQPKGGETINMNNLWTDLTRSIVWRLLRGAVAAAITQTLVLQVNWTNPDQAVKAVSVSFVTGFLMALAVGVRSAYGNPDKSSGVLNKLPL